MADANLTAARVRELLHYDPGTGVLAWRVAVKNGAIAAGSPAGRANNHGYLNIGIDNRTHKAHRLAWLHYYGCHPLGQIDHINGIRTDNRIVNLRDVSSAMNRHNIKGAPRAKASGLPLGVALTNRASAPYRAQIRIRGRLTFLGHFETADAAHVAYVDMKRRAHEGCTI